MRARGASGRSPSIASIGVASTTLPPYSPIASEMAPITRGTPAASGQLTGEPEKPGPMPVSSTAAPLARTRMRGSSVDGSPLTTSSTSTSKRAMSVPRTTDAPVQRMPAATWPSGMIGSAADAAGAPARAAASAARIAVGAVGRGTRRTVPGRPLDRVRSGLARYLSWRPWDARRTDAAR